MCAGCGVVCYGMCGTDDKEFTINDDITFECECGNVFDDKVEVFCNYSGLSRSTEKIAYAICPECNEEVIHTEEVYN